MKNVDDAPLILVIEDDAAILRGLTFNLEAEGYQVRTASDGASGLSILESEEPDVLILDLMLPEVSGYEICQKLRDEGRDTPILMLTARGEETDRVLGLDLGADDYVTKPFSIRELLARVRALVRRHRKALKLPEEILIGDLVVDFRRYEARRGEESFKMTRKEFAVLKVLATNAGEVVTRSALLTEVWGFDRLPTTRTVDNHIRSLRSKLEPDPSNPRYLLTVHGVGYKLVV
jgi:two-component system response regulator VicR